MHFFHCKKKFSNTEEVRLWKNIKVTHNKKTKFLIKDVAQLILSFTFCEKQFKKKQAPTVGVKGTKDGKFKKTEIKDVNYLSMDFIFFVGS